MPSNPGPKALCTLLRRLRVTRQLLVYHPPSRKPAEVAVIDEEVRVDLAAHVVGVARLFRVRAIDCVGWDALILQEFHSLV